MSQPILLGISGALRTGSYNRQLLRHAAGYFDGTYAEANLHLPLYDGDLEENEGIPQPVQTLADQIAQADAVLISTPEYNQSFSGVLKNALDWVSRTEGTPWSDKPVALVSAAAGRAGGARANYALRLAMTPFRPRLLTGPEVLVAGSYKEFDENGVLTNDIYDGAVKELVAALQASI